MIGKLAIILLAGMTAAQADVVISSKPTANMNCSAGVCSPTAAKAVLNATDLTNMLAGGDVKVTTGRRATNIVVKDAFGWTSTSRLTVDAMQSVEFDKPVSVAGTGAVTIATNDGGSGGDLLFGDKGTLTFWDLSSSLIVNGSSYTLVGDIKTLAVDIAANPSGFYALANDYDASVDGTYTTSPVIDVFTGLFDGLGHAFSNLNISATDDTNVGLFGNMGSGGTVRDIVLQNITIAAENAGSLTGRNDGLIVHALASGQLSIHGSAYPTIGGLVGYNTGFIDSSSASIRITGPFAWYVGGLVGRLDGSTGGAAVVQNSFASGTITLSSSGEYAGGLVGESFAGEVTRSHAAVDIRLAEGNVGGLVGVIGSYGRKAVVDQSFAAGNIVMNSHQIPCKNQPARAAGFAGVMAGAKVSSSYALGNVSAGDGACVGGFAGFVWRSSDISTSYSTGGVSSENPDRTGGFAGTLRNRSSLKSSYWDLDTSGTERGVGRRSEVDGLVGLSDVQMKSGLPDGFDRKIWGQSPSINNGYPYLLANPPPK